MKLHLHLPYELLARQLTAHLPETLYEGSPPIDLVDLTAWKLWLRQPCQLSRQGDQLLLQIPLQGEGSVLRAGFAALSSLPMLGGLSGKEKISFALSIQIWIAPDLRSNWQIHSPLKSAFVWDQKPAMRLGMVDIPLTTVFKPVIELALSELSEEIRQWLHHPQRFRMLVADAWQQMQAPLSLEESPSVFLHLRPSKIAAEAIQLQEKDLLIPLNLDLRAEIRPLTDPGIALMPLPDLQDAQDRFLLDWQLRYSWQELSSWLSAQTFRENAINFQCKGLSATSGRIVLQLKGQAKKLGVNFPFRVLLAFQLLTNGEISEVEWDWTESRVPVRWLGKRLEKSLTRQLIKAAQDAWKTIRQDLLAELRQQSIDEVFRLESPQADITWDKSLWDTQEIWLSGQIKGDFALHWVGVLEGERLT
ncbi:MAG: DUF4403 family protein [Bacteroidota bacterium]